MRKLNEFAFTLIELLAVITIMGILMIVAIPAIGKVIDNVRKDMFIDTAKQYVNGVKNLWISDSLECLTGSSTVPKRVSTDLGTGEYYVNINSAKAGSSESISLYKYYLNGIPKGNASFAFVNNIEKSNSKGEPYVANSSMSLQSIYYPVLLDSGGKSPWGNKDVRGFVRITVNNSKATFNVFLTDNEHTIKSSGNYTKLKRSHVVDYNESDFWWITGKWCNEV